MLGFVASWFTPTVLFVVLNVVIGTIFITSNFRAHNKPHQQPLQNTDELYPTHLVRAPSLLERVRSIDFSFYRSENPINNQRITSTALPSSSELRLSWNESGPSISLSLDRKGPDPLQPETHLAGDHEPQSQEIHVTRSKSDKSGEAPPRRESAPERMAKSASENSRMAVAAEDEEEVVVRPRAAAAARDRKQTTPSGEDDGVDAKADDFINRFKQQLKLQRLESLLRYREMLNRGSSK